MFQVTERLSALIVRGCPAHSFRIVFISAHITMNEGLSRRRVGAGAGGGGAVVENNGAPLNASSQNIARAASPSVPSPVNGSASYGGTALEGGNKVAYDPRDLVEQEQDGGKTPLLTLLDEVLLLGLKDKQVRAFQMR